MKAILKFLCAAAIIFALTLTVFAIRGWISSHEGNQVEMLGLLLHDMPADSSAVLYADVAQIRQAAFAQKLLAWAPKPQTDSDYARFVQETGFDYERDLRRIAFSAARRGSESIWFVIFDGHFDQKKILAYLAKNAALQKRGGYDIYSIPTDASAALATNGGEGADLAGAGSHVSLTFLRSGRIAATNDVDVETYLEQKNPAADAMQWQSRFTRLAGCPVFVVVRQTSEALIALNAQTLKGFESPQLSSLLGQLSWITVAAQPDKDSLRLVAEGESPADPVARQLADMLNGVVLLAQLGLNDPKTRQRLDPQAREAYLELLKTADITRVDRDAQKGVRVVLEITPNFLNVASLPSPAPSTPPAAGALPPQNAQRKAK